MGVFDFLKTKRKTFVVNPHPEGSIEPVVLLFLDGWGFAPPSQGNAIFLAKTPNMDNYPSIYPHTELQAAGESVGLPANEDGNSEVGHLTGGAGRVMYQSLVRINKEIESGAFFSNRAFVQAVEHTKTNKSTLHIMGLVSSGEVHSSLKHLYALIDFCKRNEVSGVKFHLFTDGRDAPPEDGVNVIEQVSNKLEEEPVGKIASVSGRYYAMDRDRRWERTQGAYDAMVLGKGKYANNAVEAVSTSYANGKTDEFLEPTVIVENQMPVGLVKDGDAIIFFNFRIDRPRQLTMAFTMKDFEKLKGVALDPDPSEHGKGERQIVSGTTFTREKWPQNIFFVSMTEYQKGIPVNAIGYPPETVDRPFTAVIAEHGLRQLHLAESEKERMVTFYFNGMRDGRSAGEDVLIVPSPKVETYDKKPEMAVYEIVDEFKRALTKNYYHFFVMNFANPDMVAHTGNMRATIAACEHVDKAVAEVVNATLAYNGTVFITADHGNAEELLTFPSTSFYFTTSEGSVNTEHSTNPVPLYIISNKYKGRALSLKKGTLSDVAPTMLGVMHLPPSPGMTGKNLLEGV